MGLGRRKLVVMAMYWCVYWPNMLNVFNSKSTTTSNVAGDEDGATVTWRIQLDSRVFVPAVALPVDGMWVTKVAPPITPP
jgi:hypothetical protein